MAKRDTINQLRGEIASVQGDLKDDLRTSKNINYHLQISKKDHEEYLDILHKVKPKEGGYDRLLRKDVDVQHELKK
jgi:hypothetical protein